jgi:hypothetical protein
MRERAKGLQAMGMPMPEAWWFAYREEAWRRAHAEPEDEEQDGHE